MKERKQKWHFGAKAALAMSVIVDGRSILVNNMVSSCERGNCFVDKIERKKQPRLKDRCKLCMKMPWVIMDGFWFRRRER